MKILLPNRLSLAFILQLNEFANKTPKHAYKSKTTFTNTGSEYVHFFKLQDVRLFTNIGPFFLNFLDACSDYQQAPLTVGEPNPQFNLRL